MNISPQSYRRICALLKEKTGIHLADDKQYLVETRLHLVLRRHGLDSLEALLNQLELTAKPASLSSENTLLQDVIDNLTTNETSFFRDTKPFKQFESIVLPEVLKHSYPSQPLRIWSAACSTGQEPYSIAMTLAAHADMMENKPWDMLATDICQQALRKAEESSYSQFEVQRGLPIQQLMHGFTQDHDRWIVRPELKQAITFKHFNLLDPYDTLGKFDVIFCRNVLIYFDEATKKSILERLTNALHPHGFLFLGASESIFGLCNGLTPVANTSGLFRKKSAT